MSIFTFNFESEWSNTEVTMKCDADALSEVLEAFENFLKGSGYVIEGTLDVVPDEEELMFDDDTDDQTIDFTSTLFMEAGDDNK